MELKLTGEVEKPLLARKEITAELSYEQATPSRIDVRKKLAELLKADENLLLVKNVLCAFGTKKAKVTAHLYNMKDDLLKNESPVTIRRNMPKQKKGEKEEKAEEKKKESEQ